MYILEEVKFFEVEEFPHHKVQSEVLSTGHLSSAELRLWLRCALSKRKIPLTRLQGSTILRLSVLRNFLQVLKLGVQGDWVSESINPALWIWAREWPWNPPWGPSISPSCSQGWMGVVGQWGHGKTAAQMHPVIFFYHLSHKPIGMWMKCITQNIWFLWNCWFKEKKKKDWKSHRHLEQQKGEVSTIW